VVVDVVLLRDRHDATINELAHRLLDRELLVGQIEVQDHSLEAFGKSAGS
jgi:hypothetical protein